MKAEIVSYSVFVAFKHASDVSVLVVGTGCREVLHTGDLLIVLLKLPRLDQKDNKWMLNIDKNFSFTSKFRTFDLIARPWSKLRATNLAFSARNNGLHLNIWWELKTLTHSPIGLKASTLPRAADVITNRTIVPCFIMRTCKKWLEYFDFDLFERGYVQVLRTIKHLINHISRSM